MPSVTTPIHSRYAVFCGWNTSLSPNHLNIEHTLRVWTKYCNNHRLITHHSEKSLRFFEYFLFFLELEKFLNKDSWILKNWEIWRHIIVSFSNGENTINIYIVWQKYTVQIFLYKWIVEEKVISRYANSVVRQRYINDNAIY